MKKFLITFSLFAFFFPNLVRACEGCKMAAVNGLMEPQTTMAGIALSWSVLFMLAFVLLLLAAFVWFVCSTCRKIDTAHRS